MGTAVGGTGVAQQSVLASELPLAPASARDPLAPDHQSLVSVPARAWVPVPVVDPAAVAAVAGMARSPLPRWSGTRGCPGRL